MRSKENAQDYRYFPEPDIPPMEHHRGVSGLAPGRSCPRWPRRRRHAIEAEFGLPEYDAGMLTGQKALADFFEEAVPAGRCRPRRRPTG